MTKGIKEEKMLLSNNSDVLQRVVPLVNKILFSVTGPLFTVVCVLVASICVSMMVYSLRRANLINKQNLKASCRNEDIIPDQDQTERNELKAYPTRANVFIVHNKNQTREYKNERDNKDKADRNRNDKPNEFIRSKLNNFLI